MIGRFCSNCGSALVNGACARCTPGVVTAPASPYAFAAAAPGYSPTYGRPGAQFIGQWNWGAFLLCPFWLMNHGRSGRGILYLVLSLIPLANMATLVMAIVYGIKGNEVAVTSRQYFDDAEFVAVENAWRNWGIGVFVVTVPLAFFGGAVAALSSGR
ncbi:MAG TPA: hypothetical protein VGN14_12790 [Candidatus Elarobacter sp.]|jgi:hypothetical protein